MHNSQIFALHFSSTSELSEFMMNGNSEEASSYCAQHRRSFDVNNPMIKEDEILVVTTEIEYSEDNLDQEEKKAEICHLRKLKRHISAPELIDGCINHLPGNLMVQFQVKIYIFGAKIQIQHFLDLTRE